MTITTTSYADWRWGDPVPVRISLGKPRWTPPGRERWVYLAELAPRPWYWRRSRETFTACYLSQLNRLADDIETKLGWLAGHFGAVTLCCWERDPSDPSTWCHRRLWADWWTGRTGQQVPELRSKTAPAGAATPARATAPKGT
jgi:hypothetical protein